MTSFNVGQVEVRDVNLPSSTFEVLGDMLPYRIHSAKIDRIFLRLPLFNLLESPIEVIVENCHVMLDSQDFATHRQEKLADDFEPALRVLSPPPDPSSSTNVDPYAFTSTWLRVVFAIANNAKVSISGLRVEVRDNLTNPKYPHCVRLQVGEFSLGQCDESGRLVSQEPSYRPTLMYAVRISALFLAMGPYDPAEEDIAVVKPPTEKNVLLSHKDCAVIVAKVNMGSDGDRMDLGFRPKSIPFVNVDTRFRDLKATVFDEHMSILWDLLQRLFWWMRCAELDWLRPSGRVCDNPCGWWRFGRDALIEELNFKLGQMGRTTWSCVMLASKRRHTYMRLYRRYVRGKKMTPDEKRHLQQLDWHFPEDCVRRYRMKIEAKYGKKSLLEKIKVLIARFTSSSSPDGKHRNKGLKGKTSATIVASDNYDVAFGSRPASPVSLASDTEFSRSEAEAKSTAEPLNEYDRGDVVDLSQHLRIVLGVERMGIAISNRAPQHECELLDLAFSGVSANFDMHMLGTSMSAQASIRFIESAEAPDQVRVVGCGEDLDMISADWSMSYDEDCTRMHIGASISGTHIHVPGPFLDKLFRLLFPTDFNRAPPIDFLMLPWDMYAAEIAQTQAELIRKAVVVPFRMTIDAHLDRLRVSANSGSRESATLMLEIGSLIATGSAASADIVDQTVFPEFKPQEHVTAKGMSIYDFFDAHISEFSLTYSLPGSNEYFDALIVATGPSDTTRSSRGSVSALTYSRKYAFEAVALVAMVSGNAPPLLVQACLKPLSVSISDAFYKALMEVLMSFIPPVEETAEEENVSIEQIAPSDVKDVTDGELLDVDGESEISQDIPEANVWVDPLQEADENRPLREVSRAMPASSTETGSRIVVNVPSVEVILIDRLIDELHDVLRIRIVDLRLRSVVGANSSAKTKLRSRVEAYYLNHLVRVWEPLLEPWLLALQVCVFAFRPHIARLT